MNCLICDVALQEEISIGARRDSNEDEGCYSCVEISTARWTHRTKQRKRDCRNEQPTVATATGARQQPYVYDVIAVNDCFCWPVV
jgi:hypothetical protein